MKKKLNMSYKQILIYSIVFVVSFICVYLSFLVNDKGFIWSGETKDGLVQHYNALMYYGKYLRELLNNIFIQHKFVIPMWDFSMGYGADIISTLHYYVIGDPLNLLSVFVPAKYTEYLYEFLVILRLYLAGFSFILYARYRNNNFSGSLLGALTYVFCGFTIFSATRHPFFINPMIYLPFLFIGVEEILIKKSSKLFIIMIALSTLSNFYFLYMLCIMVFVYTVIRYLDINKKIDLHKVIKTFFIFVRNAIVGFMIASVILLPVIGLFLNTSRSQDKILYDLFYGINYYKTFLLNSISYNYSGSFNANGLTSVSLLTLFLLLISKKNYALKISWILAFVGLCLPFVGSMFNGFSYPSNRWVFGYVFVISLILTEFYKKLFDLSKKEKIVLTIMIAIYGFLLLKVDVARNMNAMISYIILLVIYLMAILSNRSMYLIVQCLIILLTIVNVSVNGYNKFSPKTRNYISEFLDFRQGYKTLTNTRSRVFKHINDPEFYRYDESGYGKYYLTNGALQNNANSTSFFYSLGNGNVSDYLFNLQSMNALSSLYSGVNNRTYMDALASVKYFVGEKNQECYKPYGYDQLVYEDNRYKVYKNKYALGLGYTYDTVMNPKEFESLDGIKKQQALLQSVYLEENTRKLNHGSIDYEDSAIPYSIKYSNGIQKTETGFIVTKNKSKVTINFDAMMNNEIYVSFDNLRFLAKKDKNGNYDTKSYVKLKYDDNYQSLSVKNDYDTYYNGIHDYEINMGMSHQTKENIIEITFEKGEYVCDGLKVIQLSMDSYDDHIKNRQENELKNIEIKDNYVYGTINLDKTKFLCLTIPYSSGWNLYVDGEKKELQKANLMFMGTYLDEGYHEIELKYSTPYLRTGAILSFVGLVVFITILKREENIKNLKQ